MAIFNRTNNSCLMIPNHAWHLSYTKSSNSLCCFASFFFRRCLCLSLFFFSCLPAFFSKFKLLEKSYLLLLAMTERNNPQNYFAPLIHVNCRALMNSQRLCAEKKTFHSKYFLSLFR